MDDTTVDRRGFLKRAAFLALVSERGLSAADAAGDQDEDAFTGPPVTCAVIGLGPWGREIVATLSRLSSVSVSAICDTYPAFLKRGGDSAPTAARYPDFRAVLASRDVEAVIVATPSHQHRDVVLAALDAGKHVYCEAPLASSIDEARAIARAAKAAAGQVFAAGLQGRSNALYRHVWDFVKSGVLGEPAMVKAQWNRKDSWRRAAPTPEREQAVNWRLARATSPGLPGEIGIHGFDLANAFLESAPVAVSGSGRTVAWKDGREIPDTVDCIVEYPRGVRAIYTATLASSFGGAHAAFLGSNSSLYVKETRAWLIKEADSALLGWEVYARKEPVMDDTGIALVADATRLLARGKEPATEGALQPEREPLYLALDNFARSIRGQARPGATVNDGLLATVVALTAHEVTLAGTRIAIDPGWYTL